MSGTASSRGVRAVSWKRRRARVASGASGLRIGRGRTRVSSGVRVDMGVLLSGGLGEPAAGQSQVDVVEGGAARADRRRSEPQLVDRRDRVGGAPLVQR